MLFLLSSTPSISSLLMFISHSSLSVRLSFFPSIYLPFLHSLLPSIFTLAFLSSFLHPSIHPYFHSSTYFPISPSLHHLHFFLQPFHSNIFPSFSPFLFCPAPLFSKCLIHPSAIFLPKLPFLPLASIVSLLLFINPSFIVYPLHIFPSIYPPIFLSLLLSSLPFLSISLIHLSSICLFTFPLINPFSDFNFSCIYPSLLLSSLPTSSILHFLILSLPLSFIPFFPHCLLPVLLSNYCFTSFPLLLRSLAPSFNFHSFFLKVPSCLLLQLKPWTDREWLTRTIY